MNDAKKDDKPEAAPISRPLPGWLKRIGRFFGVTPIEYAPRQAGVTAAGEAARVTKDLGAAFLAALFFIQFVIQAFKIPTGSMENSLLVGDFLLGLKFVYGSPIPFTYNKLPGLREPRKNDVVIFKFPGDPNYPNNEKERYVRLFNTLVFGYVFWDKEAKTVVLHSPKDFIKRCVAAGGDTIRYEAKKLFVNNREVALAPRGQYVDARILPPDLEPRDTFGPYAVPRKGDTLRFAGLSPREFQWARSLVYQENPTSKLQTVLRVFVADSLYTTLRQTGALYVKYSEWDWHALGRQLDKLSELSGDKPVRAEWELSLDGKRISDYVLRYNAFFLMGDNRDNSLDSRYWGFVSMRFVKAKAFILYFSLDSFEPLLPFFKAVRFSRIGKLIF